MKQDEKQLYICDHAGMPNCAPNCQGNKPHDSKKDPIVCGYTKVLVKHIPYTPPDDIGPHTPKENCKGGLKPCNCDPVKLPEEPVMKKVIVFASIAVPKTVTSIELIAEDKYDPFNDYHLHVDVIDADRVTDEIINIGPWLDSECRVITIKPEPAPQETVEEVMSRMPLAVSYNYGDPEEFDYLYTDLAKWQIGLKEAKEREDE